MPSTPTEPVVPPVEDPKEPTPLTQDDLDKAVADANTAHLEQIDKIKEDNQKNTNELIAMMNQKNYDNQPVVPQAVPGISDEDFQKGIEEGNTGVVSKYFDQKLDANNKKWEEKLGQIQSYGLSAIGELARSQASNSKDMPFYGEFKGEIDALLKEHNASDPVSIRSAYEVVVGRNMTKILASEAEKKARQANDPAGSITPGDANVERGSNNSENFDPVKAVSAEAIKALSVRHDPVTLDQYTQKMNRGMGTQFEDFEAMHKKREELIAEDKELNTKW